MNFHLKIECPSWFKIGDWDKVEKTLLRLGEFGNEPDACGASIGEMAPDFIIDLRDVEFIHLISDSLALKDSFSGSLIRGDVIEY